MNSKRRWYLVVTNGEPVSEARKVIRLFDEGLATWACGLSSFWVETNLSHEALVALDCIKEAFQVPADLVG